LVENALEESKSKHKRLSRKEIQHRYYLRHKQEILEYGKKWIKKNIEKKRLYLRRSYYKYRKKRNAYARQYQKEHPEQKKETDKRYRQKYGHQIYLRGKPRALKWMKSHPKQRRLYLNKYRNVTRDKILDILGNMCTKCLERDRRCLEVDHKYNDGNIARKTFSRLDREYRYYIRNPNKAKTRLQILCANCHLKKHRK
jgi:hypothetical protein